jgi:hypothetical protein
VDVQQRIEVVQDDVPLFPPSPPPTTFPPSHTIFGHGTPKQNCSIIFASPPIAKAAFAVALLVKHPVRAVAVSMTATRSS